MKATDLLREQHQEIERLFQRLQAAEEERERASLREELANVLAGHSVIETEIFYPSAMEANGSAEEIREAVEEHNAVEFALYNFLRTPPGDESFAAKAMVMSELFTRHVEEREEALLSQAETSLGEERLEDLGADMEARFEKVQQRPVVNQLASRLGLAVAAKPVRKAPAKKKAAPRRAPAKQQARATKRTPARGASQGRSAKTARSRKGAR